MKKEDNLVNGETTCHFCSRQLILWHFTKELAMNREIEWRNLADNWPVIG